MDPENPVLQCWACNVLVSVPVDPVTGRPSEYLKCGWCGAISRLQHEEGQQQQQQRYAHQQQQLAARPCPGVGRQLLHYVCVAWRWLVVALVLTLMLSLVGTGIFLLLPRVCSTWLTYAPNLLLACVLTTQVLFNYVASVAQSPGDVAEYIVPPSASPAGVTAGSFDCWSWCRRCQAAKPPAAHHCSTCRKCVIGLDHHCPFINNCVGRGTLPQFLLFLVWAILAACYMLLMCSLLIWQNWDVVSSSSIAPSRAAAASARGTSGMHPQPGSHCGWDFYFVLLAGVLVMAVQAAPGWLLATYYLVVVSLAVCAAVGLLLLSQLYYLSMGVSYIDHLKTLNGSSNAGAGQHQNGGSCAGLQQQQAGSAVAGWVRRLLGAAGLRCRVLWVQLLELYGAAGASQLAAAVLIPRWKQPRVLGAKKQT